jgi:hypothetical protein
MGDFESCKVVGFGRELKDVHRENGTVRYESSPEMIRRADEIGMYWQANAGKIDSVVCSGGYPGAALGMPRPPEGINEGGMLKKRLVRVWKVPDEKIAVEGESASTYENFSMCIADGLLRPGEFSPERPLVLSVSTPHSWRIGMLAMHTLQLPEGSLFRLHPGSLENNAAAHERNLAVVTQLAIERTTIQPGHPDYATHIGDMFGELWHGGDKDNLLAAFNAKHGDEWLPPDIPILDYPVVAVPSKIGDS